MYYSDKEKNLQYLADEHKKNEEIRKKKVYKVNLKEFDDCHSINENLDIKFLSDIQMDLKVELGKTKKSTREILSLECGHIIELDRIAGENIDVLINEEYFAKGEIVVLDDSYGVRITSINKK